MANNCLVTKLKGVVDNDNLPVLGSFRINCQVGSGTYINKARFDIGIQQDPSKPVTAVLIGSGYFTDSTFTQNLGKEINLNISASFADMYNLVYIYLAADSFIEIRGAEYSSKMSLALVWNCYIDFDSLWSYRNFYRIALDARYSGDDIQPGLASKFTGSIDNIANPNTIAVIDVARCVNVKGSLSKFANSELLIGLSCFRTSVSGDISVLTKMGLTAGEVNTFIVSYCPNIFGRIETLIESFVSNGASANDITFSAYQSGCTLNNLPAPPDGQLSISSGVATLKDLANPSNIFATYDGTSWTYGTW